MYYEGKPFPIEDYDILFQSRGIKNPAIGQLKSFAESKGVYLLPSFKACKNSSNKFYSYRVFKEDGLRIPKTILIQDPHASVQTIAEQASVFDTWPLLVKPNNGSLGRGIETVKSTENLLAAVRRNPDGLLLQEYISPNLRVDERHMVIGDRVVSSMRRLGKEGQVATNFQARGDREPITCDAETEYMCVEACRLLELEYAGVDIIRDEQGVPYLLEANCYPFDAIINVTGYNYFNDLLDYFKTIV